MTKIKVSPEVGGSITDSLIWEGVKIAVNLLCGVYVNTPTNQEYTLRLFIKSTMITVAVKGGDLKFFYDANFSYEAGEINQKLESFLPGAVYMAARVEIARDQGKEVKIDFYSRRVKMEIRVDGGKTTETLGLGVDGIVRSELIGCDSEKQHQATMAAEVLKQFGIQTELL